MAAVAVAATAVKVSQQARGEICTCETGGCTVGAGEACSCPAFEPVPIIIVHRMASNQGSGAAAVPCCPAASCAPLPMTSRRLHSTQQLGLGACCSSTWMICCCCSRRASVSESVLESGAAGVNLKPVRMAIGQAAPSERRCFAAAVPDQES